VIAGLIERRGGIESRNLSYGNQQIGAAAAEVQRQRGGSPSSRLGVIEVGIGAAAGDVVVDRSGQPAGEGICGTVGDAADIQRPEAHSHDQGVPGGGGLGQRQGDRTAGSRLTAEGGFLDQRNGGWSGDGETVGERASLVVGIGDGDVACA